VFVLSHSASSFYKNPYNQTNFYRLDAVSFIFQRRKGYEGSHDLDLNLREFALFPSGMITDGVANIVSCSFKDFSDDFPFFD